MKKIRWLTQAFSVRAVDGSKLRAGCVGTVDGSALSGCTAGEHYDEINKPGADPTASTKPKPKADPKAETSKEES